MTVTGEQAAAGNGTRAAGRAAVICSGPVPPLADAFTARPQSVPGLAGLEPGTAVALVPAAPGMAAGACGKTQLAAWHAGTACQAGGARLMFWVDASSRAAALTGYVQAAGAAGTGTGGPAEQAAARLARWLAGTAVPWLMVLDDLRDAASLDGIWPSGPAGRVLITAPDQRPVCGPDGQPRALVVPVGGFSPREALTYLMTRLSACPDQRHGAIDLAIAAGGHPLALAQASAVITTTSWSCRDYLARYAAARDTLAASRPGSDPPAPAAVTTVLSADRAGELAAGGTARLLLAVTAMLDGATVPGAVLSAPAVRDLLARPGGHGGADAAREAVRVLEDCGLISTDPPPATPAVRMSRLTAALARASEPARALRQAADTAAEALAQAWPQEEPDIARAAGLRSCAEALQRTAPAALRTAGGCHKLLALAGHSLDTARLTGPAALHWQHAAGAASRLAGPDSPDALAAAARLARALSAAGRPAEAARHWQQLAGHHGRLSGPGHPGTLTALTELGRATAAAGQPGRAITILEHATTDAERSCGPGHPATLAARDALAAACHAAGRHRQAVSCRERNLADLESVPEPAPGPITAAREALAAACLASGNTAAAISCYQQALASRQEQLGADHPGTVTTRLALADACHAGGKIAAALAHREQACASCQRTLGPAHPQTLACRAGLAAACHHAGHLADAATLLRDTLATCEQSLPPGHHLTRDIRHAITTLGGR